MTERDVEMNVQGMWDLFLALGGDGHSKMYDPLTFEGGVAHSYSPSGRYPFGHRSRLQTVTPQPPATRLVGPDRS